MSKRHLIFFIPLVLILLSCNNTERLDAEESKREGSDLPKKELRAPEELRIGYAYWWTVVGPFKGCGTPFAMAAIATVDEIGPERKDKVMGLTRQKGLFGVDRMLATLPLGDLDISSLKQFSSDGCAGSNLRVGDQALVLAFEYEHGYAHSGSKAIIKISGENDPLVRSIEQYIASGYDPFTIESDTSLWASKGMGEALGEVLQCRRYKRAMEKK